MRTVNSDMMLTFRSLDCFPDFVSEECRGISGATVVDARGPVKILCLTASNGDFTRSQQVFQMSQLLVAVACDFLTRQFLPRCTLRDPHPTACGKAASAGRRQARQARTTEVGQRGGSGEDPNRCYRLSRQGRTGLGHRARRTGARPNRKGVAEWPVILWVGCCCFLLLPESTLDVERR